MKNTEEQGIEEITELLKNFVPVKTVNKTKEHILYEMFDCVQLETIVGLHSKYQSVKDFFEKELYKLDIFYFEHFWEFSNFYNKQDLKKCLSLNAVEAAEDFKNKYYFLLAVVSKKSIYNIIMPDIAYSIAKALTDPRLHIEAEYDATNVVASGDVSDCADA